MDNRGRRVREAVEEGRWGGSGRLACTQAGLAEQCEQSRSEKETGGPMIRTAR